MSESSESEAVSPDTTCGVVAIIGEPNVGKTTLTNALVGQKAGIVTPKVQTTRTRLRGIAIVEKAQMILVDTPGIFEPQKRLDRAMVHEAWAAVQDADEVILVLDAARDIDPLIFDGLVKVTRPISLVLNKIDLLSRAELLARAEVAHRKHKFARSFMVAASKNRGVADIKSALASAMPKGAWLYPDDIIADIPSRLLAAEITREKLFLNLHQELPYALSVETDAWEEKANGIRIEQTIYVRRDGQKSIMLGKGGKMIKLIGEQSRRELEKLFDSRVHLFLFVKVRKNWQDDPERYRALGLTYKV